MVLYLVLMMTPLRQAGIHSILITIWNRYFEQVFGTGIWNRYLEQVLGTGTWNRYLEQVMFKQIWVETLDLTSI